MAQDIGISIGLVGLSQYRQGLTQAETATKKSGTRMSRSFGSAATSLSGITSQVPGLGTAFAALTNPITAVAAALIGAGTAFVSFTKTAAAFESQLATVNALIPITERTEESFAALRTEAAKLGSETEFSATEAAQAMEFLAKAGFNTSEILATTADTLSLATVGGLSLAKASDIASDTLSQFGLNAGELGRVVDVIAATSTSANTNVQQFADGMNYLGATANALGIPLEEASAAIGTLASGGLKGSLGTRALGTALVRLAKPTKQAQAVIDDLGLAFFNSEGQFIGLNNTIGVLEDAFVGMTDQQQQAALTSLFGAEAIQEFNLLLQKGSEGLTEYTKELEEAGAQGGAFAQGIRELKLDTFEGAIKQLSSAWEGFSIAIGSKGLPGLKEITLALAGVVRGFTSVIDGSKNFGQAFGPIGGLIDRVVAAYGRLFDAIGGSLAKIFGDTATAAKSLGDIIFDVVLSSLNGLITGIEASIDVISFFASIIGDAISFLIEIGKAIFDAAGAVSSLINEFLEFIGVGESFNNIGATISGWLTSVKGLFLDASGATLSLREALATLRGAFSGSLAFIQTIVRNFVDGFGKSLEGIGDIVAGIFNQSSGQIQAGYDKLLIGAKSSTVDVFSGAAKAYTAAFNAAVPKAAEAVDGAVSGVDLSDEGAEAGQTFIRGIFSQIGGITDTPEGKALALALKNQVKDAYNDSLISTDQYRQTLAAIDQAARNNITTVYEQASAVEIFGRNLQNLNAIGTTLTPVEIPIALPPDINEGVTTLTAAMPTLSSAAQALGFNLDYLKANFEGIPDLLAAAESGAFNFAAGLGASNQAALEFSVNWGEAMASVKDVALDTVVNSISVLGEELINVANGTQTFKGAMLSAFAAIVDGLLVQVPRILGMVLLKSALTVPFPANLPLIIGGLALMGLSGLGSGIVSNLKSKSQAEADSLKISTAAAGSIAAGSSSTIPAATTAPPEYFRPTGLGGQANVAPSVNVTVFVGNEELAGVVSRTQERDRRLRGY